MKPAAAALSDDAGLADGTAEAFDDRVSRLVLSDENLSVIATTEPKKVCEGEGGVMRGRRDGNGRDG